MKIAFVYDFPYPWHAGGIEKIDKIESEGLARSNEVHFYTMLWPGMKHEFTRNRVHYHACWQASTDTMYLHRRRSVRKALIFALTAFRIFPKRFDAVIIDEFPYLHIPVVRLYRLLTGCKIVMHVAEVWDLPYWKSYAGSVIGTLGWLFSRLALSADVYLANSYDTKSRLEKMMHIDGKKVQVFAPVLDTKLITSARLHARKRNSTVVFAGRLIKEKRVDKWLYEFAETAKRVPDLHGLIIGDGPEKRYLENMIMALHLDGKIKLIGPVPTTSGLYRKLASCRAMLNMSEREGLSIVTLESLELGVPVVLPDYSPIPREIKSMCNVEHELGIPRVLESILRSGDASAFIHRKEKMDAFQTSAVERFYKRLFGRLGFK